MPRPQQGLAVRGQNDGDFIAWLNALFRREFIPTQQVVEFDGEALGDGVQGVATAHGVLLVRWRLLGGDAL